MTNVARLLIATMVIVVGAAGQENSKPDSSAQTTIVTAGDVSLTKDADGKTTVVVNFVAGVRRSEETTVTFSGPYSLDVNGGVKQIKGPRGIELHVLSHEELRSQAPEIEAWEKTNKNLVAARCHDIPNYPGCGYPQCDQINYPGFVCRYKSGSGCACSKGKSVGCTDSSDVSKGDKTNK